jgi:hypothetical protein
VRFRINSRSAALAAVSAAVLVPLGVFGAPALARSAAAASQYEYGSGATQYKVAICHHTHSKKHPWHVINVSSSAVKAHMKHGDTLAPCPAPPPAQPKHASGNDDSSTTSGSSHGQSGDQHGKSGEQHGQSGDEHGQSGSHGNGHGK